MRLSMRERRTVRKALAERYRRSRKREKGRIVSEVVEALKRVGMVLSASGGLVGKVWGRY